MVVTPDWFRRKKVLRLTTIPNTQYRIPMAYIAHSPKHSTPEKHPIPRTAYRLIIGIATSTIRQQGIVLATTYLGHNQK